MCQEDLLQRAAQLDNRGQCEEAERVYQQALADRPPSTALLNNVGNHYLVCGRPDQAQSYFERLLKISPSHANASLQLARIATERKQGARALQYLARVQDAAPAVRLLRAEALQYAGRHADALTVIDGLQSEANGDAGMLFALGLACARMGLYDRSEAAFNGALAAHPDDFDLLYNLGRAAGRARHFDRAQRVLEVAVKLRPEDADALFELGLSYAALQDYSKSVYILAQARQHAPRRPDILLALARAAEDAGYFGDSALAYDEYLQIRPEDDTARRDRARVCGFIPKRQEEALGELARYIGKHPKDAIGYFDLAQLTWTDKPDIALEQLSTAVRLDPGFVPAHFARAWLLHRLGHTADSITPLKTVVRLQPGNVVALDQLGLAYLSLDRPSEAEKVLRDALAIAPQDPQVLLHLGRALIALDRQQEAQPYLDQFQKLRPRRARDPRLEPGMIELATMSQGDRTRSELDRLRRDAQTHPGDPELQLQLAGLLLADNRLEDATAAYQELLAGNPGSSIWYRAGTALARAGQYQLARDFLERAADHVPAARLDLAVALFFTAGPQAALETIDTVPEAERGGDYSLMKARILDAAGRQVEAAKILEEGLHGSASRPDIAIEAALLLLRHNRPIPALGVLREAAKANPDNPDLLLDQAVVMALTKDTGSAARILKQIESRWPEWSRVYLVHGLLLESMRQTAAARRNLQTAIALDSADLAARCGLARLGGEASPSPECTCVQHLTGLLLPSCR